MATNFIQHSKNVLTLKECKSLIDFYEDNERYHTEGSVDVKGMDVDDKDKKGMEWKKNIMYIERDQMKFQSGYFSSLGKVIVDGINQYKREYYENYNGKLRVTVDTSHKIYDQRFYKKVNLTNKALIQKYIIVEFKFDRKDNHLSKIMLKTLPFRISRSSKYINSIRSVSGI